MKFVAIFVAVASCLLTAQSAKVPTQNDVKRVQECYFVTDITWQRCFSPNDRFAEDFCTWNGDSNSEAVLRPNHCELLVAACDSPTRNLFVVDNSFCA
jgi:hypothetical protein